MKALAVLLLAIVAPSLTAAQDTGEVTGRSGARLRYSRNRETAVVTMIEEIGELRDADPGPAIRIYGDGRAVVHHPAYLKTAGDYELRLSAADFDNLLGDVADADLPGFDAKAIKARRADAHRSRRQAGLVLDEQSDPSITVITVRAVDLGSSASARKAPRAFDRELRWPGLTHDAQRYPEIAELQGLERVHRRLAAILAHPDGMRRLR